MVCGSSHFELMDDLSWPTKFFVNWYLYSFDKVLSKNKGLINSDRDSLFAPDSIEFNFKNTFESKKILKAFKKSQKYLVFAKFISNFKLWNGFRIFGKIEDDAVFRTLYSFQKSTTKSYSKSPKKLNNYEISIIYFTLAAYSGVTLQKEIIANIFGFYIHQVFSSVDYETLFFLIEKSLTTGELVPFLNDISRFLSKQEQVQIQKFINNSLIQTNVSVNELLSCNKIHNFILGKESL